MMGEPPTTTRARSTSMKENSVLIEEVIKDIMHNKSFLSLVQDSIDKKISRLQETIEIQEADIMDLQTRNTAKDKEIDDLKKKVNEHTDRLKAVSVNINAQEQYSRRNCLRFFGCPERKGESTDSIVMKMVNDILKVNLTVDDIERSHRVGMPGEPLPEPAPGAIEDPTAPTKTYRGIIVKFKSYRKRQEIILNRRKLKGRKRAIVEDLTAKNQKLLAMAKGHPHVEAAWSNDGRIIALLSGKDHKKKLIRNEDDLKSLPNE